VCDAAERASAWNVDEVDIEAPVMPAGLDDPRAARAPALAAGANANIIRAIRLNPDVSIDD
jgi:hypothetical protein